MKDAKGEDLIELLDALRRDGELRQTDDAGSN
jgi:hypothetical protein